MSKMFTWMKQSQLSLLLALILAVGLLVGGCGGGSDSYDDPTVQETTKTATPLIEAETLKSWMDAGLVNAGYMQDNVVILNVSAADGAVIPGAYKWVRDDLDEVRTTRVEGLTPAPNMVQTDDIIDAVLQRSGVNNLSTIVLTGDGTFDPTVAYFTLRYWGFPKSRIKVLNGYNSGWDDAATAGAWGEDYARSTSTPKDVQDNPYNFSVRNIGKLNDQLRYSIAEVIQAVDANLAGQDASTGNTVNIIPNGNRFRVLNTSLDVQDQLFAHPQYINADKTFKTAAEIEATLSSYTDFGGFNPNLPTITHCGSGLSCTPIFFALDAILGLNVGVWDGSSTQWGYYGARNVNNEEDWKENEDYAEEDAEDTEQNVIVKTITNEDGDEVDLYGDWLWTMPLEWDVNVFTIDGKIIEGESRSAKVIERSASAPAPDAELLNLFERIQDINDPAFNQIEEEDKSYIEGGAEDGAPEAGSDLEGGC